jgi:hypothetical protein
MQPGRTRGSGLARTSESKLARIARATSLRLNALALEPRCASPLGGAAASASGVASCAAGVATGRTLLAPAHAVVLRPRTT